MKPTRLALATVLAAAGILTGLFLPLQALVALRFVPAAGPKNDPAGVDAGQETARDPATRARAPLVARVDGRGRLRRAYFPRAPLVGPAAERAEQLLGAEAMRLGIAANRLEFEIESVRRSPSGEHVRLQQVAGGVPVWGAEAVVSFDATLAPIVVASDLEELPAAVVASPSLQPLDACSLAVRSLGASDLHAEPQVRLYHRRRGGTWRLEYRVVFASARPTGDWEVWVDACGAGRREVRDRTVFGAPRRAAGGTAGSGRVFLPDPCLAMGDPALRDQSDADAAVSDAAYATVVLPDLDAPLAGFYRLAGPHAALRDWESPGGAPDSSRTPDFARRRSEQGFEDVMVYYHLDAMQRWYRQLGFQDANARCQVADAHGVYGQDNSKFVPTLHAIAFGEGGVDDAEDAEVIVHEYAHATQYDIVPTWGGGGDEAAMGEGFGDYLANSYAWSLFPQRVEAWNGLFQWDGHNEYWPGRRALDTSLRYPPDASASLYRAGTLWCSALSDALYALHDREVMDRLVLDSLYMLTGAATMEDAANAILAADLALHRGAHLEVLVEAFGRWGLVDASSWRPVTIEHAPLDITATAAGAPRIEARIVSSAGAIDATSAAAWVRPPGAEWTRLGLEPEPGDLYGADLRLPASADVDLEYYLEARDALGNVARFPAAGSAAPLWLHAGFVAERFETESGWSAVAPDDDAIAGRWLRAVPVGTAAQPGADHSSDGERCFVTGNTAPGAPASDGDVDGGKTTLTSPTYDLRGAASVRLSYWRWYGNDQGTSPDEDPWSVDVSADDGATWVPLESTRVSEACWRRMEFDLGGVLGSPGRLCIRFVACDRGGASLVEAAVDDMLLQVRYPTDVGLDPRAGVSSLLPNRPNPCNPSTELCFRLADPGFSSLALYDIRGRLVRTLVSRSLPAGTHAVAWDGRDALGAPVASGVYLVRLTTAAGSMARRITVVR